MVVDFKSSGGTTNASDIDSGLLAPQYGGAGADTSGISGIPKLTSGVVGAAAEGTDYLGPNQVTTGVTAATTQTQGQGAISVTSGKVNVIYEVATCATANDTVTLPAAVAGLTVLVINNGAQTLQVFPASGDDLGQGVNTATTIAAGASSTFVALDSTDWLELGESTTGVTATNPTNNYNAKFDSGGNLVDGNIQDSGTGINYYRQTKHRFLIAGGGTTTAECVMGSLSITNTYSDVPDRKLDVTDTTGPQMRLTYDSSNYVETECKSNGVVDWVPTGGKVNLWNGTGKTIALVLEPSAANPKLSSTTDLSIGPANNRTLILEGGGGADYITIQQTQAWLSYGATERMKWNSTGIGFFGATPVAQQTHVTDADGTTGGNQTAINAVISRLEALGLFAAS